MKIIDRLKDIFAPSLSRHQRLEQWWSQRTKTTRIEWTFENGVKNELVGEDAAIYAKGLYYCYSGFVQEGRDMIESVKSNWKRVEEKE